MRCVVNQKYTAATPTISTPNNNNINNNNRPNPYQRQGCGA